MTVCDDALFALPERVAAAVGEIAHANRDDRPEKPQIRAHPAVRRSRLDPVSSHCSAVDAWSLAWSWGPAEGTWQHWSR